AYVLLKKALLDTQKLGVATFVMRQKEHLCLVGVYKDVLVLHVIRFSSEIRNPAKLELPDEKISKRELDMAKSLIEQYSEKFDFGKYTDVYNEQLMEIIRQKSKGEKPKAEKVEVIPTAATDLMA